MDLFIACIVVGCIAFVVAIAVAVSLRPRMIEAHRRLPALLLTLFILLALGLLFGTKDQLYWARAIPSSAAIIYSNLSVLALAAAAGAAARLPQRPLWRRLMESGALAVLALAALVQPIFQPILRPSKGDDRWAVGGVCLQSAPASCSAAAGATLLKAHGIDTTERQMVKWCLTDSRGTPSLGLWRGLCIATENADVAPRVLTTSVDELLTRGPWPVLLFCGLPSSGADPSYINRGGWTPGLRHSVVLFGLNPDGSVDIGDPETGRELWSAKDLHVLWRGGAIALSN